MDGADPNQSTGRSGSDPAGRDARRKKRKKAAFPLRVKPDYYRKQLYKILTRSEGQNEAVRRLRRMVAKIQDAQVEQLGRAMNAEETRVLNLAAYRDMRNVLLALGLDICARDKGTTTQFTRTKNLPYVRWRVDKEILMQHWKIDMNELVDRQMKSGMRMPKFLDEHICNEGLI